jgi:hypothetical protein
MTSAMNLIRSFQKFAVVIMKDSPTHLVRNDMWKVTREIASMTEQQQFIYHLVPRQMHGHGLYPLNRLREVAPDLAQTAFEKYAGRESVLERRIPPLNCLRYNTLKTNVLTGSLNEC